MLRWHGRNALKTFKVKSRTNFNPDLGEFESYTVELWGDGMMCCNCMWGQKGSKKKPCWHITRKKEELIKEFGSIEKAVEHYRNQNTINPKVADTILNGEIRQIKNE